MPRYSKQAVSEQTKSEAAKIAGHIQKPGQSKEQTKLVAQGIQKGIELYKKQQKAKARELDKKLKKTSVSEQKPVEASTNKESHNNRWLPWAILVLSWLGFALYVYLSASA